MKPIRVVIIGGGFAAVQFAKTLRAELRPSDCEILLFNCVNHMVFHPLLADVAGASINVDAAAAPLRQMLPGVGCRTERVERIDLSASEIEYDEGNDSRTRLHYDHVVLACGADSNLGIIPGMTEHAFAFKVMRDAIDLRQHVVRQMERAEATNDPERRRWFLHFIIVGGGFSGVEVAGELNELVRSSTRFYRSFREEDVVVSMVHSQDQILPEVAPTLRDFARKKMEKAGVTILLNSRAVAATHEGIELEDGRKLLGATIVCTIGTTPSALVQSLHVPKEKGRIRTTPEMRIEGQTNAWALGDCAFIINDFDKKASATTAQFAERQGRQAARNLIRVLHGEPTKPFSFKALGQLCSIGGYSAVAEIFGTRFSGFPAWFMWRGVYLFKLPTWSRRFKVALDWAWDLLFPRDLGFLNTDTTLKVTHGYYLPGDYIHRQGELAHTFYIVDEGEVEALKATPPDTELKVVAILSKGDFFGEATLLGDHVHETSVRARTEVRLMQIGSGLFAQLAGASIPLRDLLSRTLTRRAGDFWRRLPLAKALLSDEPLASLLDPVPDKALAKDTTLADAARALNESARGELLILDEKQRFWGTLDRNGLYDMVGRIAITSPGERGDLTRRKLSDLLPPNPAYVSVDDSVLVAYTAMLDRGTSWLPVVHSKDDLQPVGCLRGAKIGNRMIQKISQGESANAQAQTAG
jgi:NADH:ubiquinone reductase (H+-translocating)